MIIESYNLYIYIFSNEFKNIFWGGRSKKVVQQINIKKGILVFLVLEYESLQSVCRVKYH